MMTCIHGLSIAAGTLALAKTKNCIWHVSSTNHGRTKTLTTSSNEWRPQHVFFDRSNNHLIAADNDLEVYRLLEATFETVRGALFPALPSRRFAFYGFPCRQCATEFKGRKGRAKSLLYSVTPVLLHAGFVGDMRLRDMSANVIRLSEMERMNRGYPSDPASAVTTLAQHYWSSRSHERAADFKPVPEVLILGSVTLSAVEDA